MHAVVSQIAQTHDLPIPIIETAVLLEIFILSNYRDLHKKTDVDLQQMNRKLRNSDHRNAFNYKSKKRQKQKSRLCIM